jgi:leucyl-tRNA---protein transferase
MVNQRKRELDSICTTPVIRLDDRDHPCVYLPDQVAKMPMIYPMRPLHSSEFDAYLEHGRRRSGAFLYHTECAACSSCEPTRLKVDDFRLTASLRRVLHRGDREIRVEVANPQVDPARLALFNSHRTERELDVNEAEYGVMEFESFLVETCCETKELSFWIAEKLIGCTIIDCGAVSVSAVYTYFDPAYSRFSPGTYSILKQIEFTKQTNRRFLYLGMFVNRNRHLRYKGRFVPQERYIDGKWTPFDTPVEHWSTPQP